MIYDSNKFGDVASVNQHVAAIQGADSQKLQSRLVWSNILPLVECLGIETCEKLLGSMGNIPYIPWRTGNRLAISQMATLFGISARKMQPILARCKGDSEKVNYTELKDISVAQEERHLYRSRKIPAILTFSNGTRFDGSGHWYPLYNARAVLYVALYFSNYNTKLKNLMSMVVASIRNTNEWNLEREDLKLDEIPEQTQMTENVPEEPQEPVTPVAPFTLIHSSHEDNAVSYAPHRGSDDVLSKFLSILPPGTEIVIRVPEAQISA